MKSSDRVRRQHWIVGVAVLLASAVGVASVFSGATSPRRTAKRLATQMLQFEALRTDTLRSGQEGVIGELGWLAINRQHRYVAVDASDRALKMYSAAGAPEAPVGGPGPEPGRFIRLLDGGAFGDSLYGYDFSKTALEIFDRSGRFARTMTLRRNDESAIAGVRDVEDSLFLLTAFPAGSHNKNLLQLIRPNGTIRSSFFNRTAFYTPTNPELIQATYIAADANAGVVVAGIFGGDSLYVYDYDGIELASGQLTLADGTPLSLFRAAIARNGGKVRDSTGHRATKGIIALVGLVVVDATHAVLQLMDADGHGQTRLDLARGGTFVAVSWDRTSHQLIANGYHDFSAGLVGRDHGSALLFRYLGDRFDRVEVTRLALKPRFSQ